MAMPPTPIYLLYNPLEDVHSFKLMGLPISHGLSWAKPHFKVGRESHSLIGHPSSYNVFPCTHLNFGELIQGLHS